MDSEIVEIARRGGATITTTTVDGKVTTMHICHCGESIEHAGWPDKWWFDNKKVFCDKHEDEKKKQGILNTFSVPDVLKNIKRQIEVVENLLSKTYV